jgi:hypothetical protein
MKLLPYNLKIRPTLTVFLLLVADGLFFTLTNPNSVPSGVLIVGFVLLAISLYVVLRLSLTAMAFYGLPLNQHSKRIALVLGLSGSLGIALQSLGELTARDILVLSLLSAIAYVYMSYGRGEQPK